MRNKDCRGQAGAVFLCALFAGLVASCTRSGPEIVPVSGTVTRDGKPVPFVSIYFQPTTGRPSVGNCDGEGRFKLGYTPDQDGAKVDTHTVFVVYVPGGAAGPAPADWKEIYKKYGTPELSPLKIEVKKAVKNLEVK